jgi:uncharacterized protein YkwD
MNGTRAGIFSSNMNRKENDKKFGFIMHVLLTALIFTVSGNCNAQEIALFFSEQEINTANTAKHQTYLNETEKDVYTILNLARTCPKKFHLFYKAYLKESGENDNVFMLNQYHKSLSRKLKGMNPMDVIYPDKQLYEMANCWANEAGRKGSVGHKRKRCAAGYSAECCTYGNHSAIDVVLSFLIDEGVKSLGHREICLSPSYHKMGVSQSKHKTYGTNTVLDFTTRKDLTVN